METKNNKGIFVISLDLELLWGVRDKRTIESYGGPIEKTHEVVPRLVDMFNEFDIKTTWATVGFLFSRNKDELIAYSPKVKPKYMDSNLSPYEDGFKPVKNSPKEDPYHFGLDILEYLKKNTEQEIASHTFSHYYCLEPGQTIDDFERDIQAAVAIAKSHGVVLKSLVFPRNQFNTDYLEVCKKHGINTVRGNANVWFSNEKTENSNVLLKKILRTLDCYINISGHHCYKMDDLQRKVPYNVPSSRFLRPYQKKGGWPLESLKLMRIKRSMTFAAKKGMLYHLWWHPHNFGSNTEENMATLLKILEHFSLLRQRYGFASMTMNDTSRLLDKV